MVFANGKESPLFQTDQGFASQKSISIPSDREIRYVSMKMRNGLIYDGLRFFDSHGYLIKTVTWAEGQPGSAWTTKQHIPKNHVIVGFKCNTERESPH